VRLTFIVEEAGTAGDNKNANLASLQHSIQVTDSPLKCHR